MIRCLMSHAPSMSKISRAAVRLKSMLEGSVLPNTYGKITLEANIEVMGNAFVQFRHP